MTTKKFRITKKRVVLLTILTLLVIAALIYTRPMTVEQIVPGLSLDHFVEVTGQHRIGPAPPSDSDAPLFTELTLTPEDPEFEQLMALFQGRTFRRSLRNLLPQGSVRTYSPTEEEFQWKLSFRSETPIELPSGDTVKGTLFQVDNFYGLLEIDSLGDTLRYTTTGKDAWLAEVMEVLSSAKQ